MHFKTDAALDAAIEKTPAARVTVDRINAVIAYEAYHRLTDVLTVCVLTLVNGFSVTGESACASPENYDQAIGEDFARKAAVHKIWTLEAYLLKQALYAETETAPTTWEQRLRAELIDIEERTSKLDTFIAESDSFAKLEAYDRELLTRQYSAMARYLDILKQRVGRI